MPMFGSLPPRWPDARSPRGTIAALVLVVVLAGATFASAASAGPSTGVAAGPTGAVHSAAPAPLASPASERRAVSGPGDVTQTTVLSNLSVEPGNDLAPNAAEPYAVAVDSYSGLVYVLSEYGTSLVTVINTTTGTLAGAVGVGINPDSVAYDPANGNVYVTNAGSDNVTVINGSTHTVSTSVGVGSVPESVVYDPVNHLVYVANGGSDNLTAINGSTETVKATIALPDAPNAMTVDTTTDDVDTLSLSAGVLMVVNASNRSVGNTYSFLANLYGAGLTFDPSNGDIYLAIQLFEGVYVLNGSTAAYVGFFSMEGAGALVYDPTFGDLDIVASYTDDVVFYDPTTHQNVSTIAVGFSPGNLSFDATNGRLYVVNSVSNNVTVISVGGEKTVGAVSVGLAPEDLAYDGPFHELFVPDGLSTVYVLNASSGNWNAIMRNVGQETSYCAIDTQYGDPYVSDSDTNHLYEINGFTDMLYASAPTGVEPEAVVYDPANGDLYVADISSDQITVVNGTNATVVATIDLPAPDYAPFSISYDSANQLLYVGYLFPSNITVLNGTTNTVVGEIVTPPDESLSIVADPSNGRLYEADDITSTVLDFLLTANGTNATLTGALPTGFGPEGMAYDPANGWLYVPNFASNNVTVLNLSDNETVGSIAVGVDPTDAVVALGGTNVDVVNLGTATISYIATGVELPVRSYPVNFTESGLPSGTEWSVTIGATTQSSATSTVAFELPNATSYTYTVGSITGYTAAPTGGSFAVAGAGHSVDLRFSVAGGGGGGGGSSGPSISSFTVSEARVALGGSVTFTVAATGGSGPLSYAYSGLPAGCSSSNASSLPCTPTATGSSNVTVTVTDAKDRSASSRVALTVVTAPSTTTPPGNGTGSSGSTVLGLPPAEGYGLIGALVAAVVVGATLAVWRRGRNPPPASRDGTPPTTASP